MQAHEYIQPCECRAVFFYSSFYPFIQLFISKTLLNENTFSCSRLYLVLEVRSRKFEGISLWRWFWSWRYFVKTSVCQSSLRSWATGKKPLGCSVYSYSMCCLERSRKKWTVPLSYVYYSVVNVAKVIYNLYLQMALEKWSTTRECCIWEY